MTSIAGGSSWILGEIDLIGGAAERTLYTALIDGGLVASCHCRSIVRISSSSDEQQVRHSNRGCLNQTWEVL